MKYLLFITIVIIALSSCKKQNDWLDEKRQTSDVVPKTLGDFQALLDNTLLMNSNYPSIGLLGCDNFYFPDESMPTLNMYNKNTYFWSKDIFGGQNSVDYSNAYNIISVANIVLENIGDVLAGSDIAEKNSIRGQALFFRSMMFLELASAFSKPYVEATADTDLGIAVRLKSDIYHVEPRSSVKRTYSRIVEDLQVASTLLPVTPLYRTRPCKPASFALLARTYLLMDDYVEAKRYTDSALLYFNGMLDFNSSDVSLGKPYRFPAFGGKNSEVIFYATGFASEGITPNAASNASIVDSLLFESYDEADLRKKYFYDLVDARSAKFRGSYTGIDKVFAGIASNEVYFIRAECNARIGNIEEAVVDLNKILERRYETGQYKGFVSADAELVLRKILQERRKEFPFTGQIRWQDLRRLNRDARFSLVLYRNSQGNIYQLPPNDPKYVYPLPQAEVDQGGLPQNER